VEDQDHFQNTPLHDAARCGNLAAVRILLQNGARFDVMNSMKWTPLDEANLREDEEIIKALVGK